MSLFELIDVSWNRTSIHNLELYLLSIDIDIYKDFWGIDLGEPVKVTYLLSDEASDYDEYIGIYDYDDYGDLLEQMCTVGSTAMRENVNRLIKEFKLQPVDAEVQDYVFFDVKNDGEDKTVILYKAKEQKVYFFERRSQALY